MEWPKWLTKRIIKERVEVQIVPWYFSVEAKEYRETIDHLKSLLEASESARRVAEQAAKQNLYPDSEVVKAMMAKRILIRIKQELDLWSPR